MGTTIVLITVMLALLFTAGAPLGSFAGLGRRPRRQPRRRSPSPSRTGCSGSPASATPARSSTRCRIGYQACQGLYALSSGGWFGLGLGASREKFGYLPNQYTDYIFAIIGEELGLLGTLRRARAVRAARVRRDPDRPALPGHASASWPRPASRPGCSARRWSTWARSSACCRSPASRCRWSPSAARPWCRRCSRSGC